MVARAIHFNGPRHDQRDSVVTADEASESRNRELWGTEENDLHEGKCNALRWRRRRRTCSGRRRKARRKPPVDQATDALGGRPAGRV